MREKELENILSAPTSDKAEALCGRYVEGVKVDCEKFKWVCKSTQHNKVLASPHLSF